MMSWWIPYESRSEWYSLLHFQLYGRVEILVPIRVTISFFYIKYLFTFKFLKKRDDVYDWIFTFVLSSYGFTAITVRLWKYLKFDVLLSVGFSYLQLTQSFSPSSPDPARVTVFWSLIYFYASRRCGGPNQCSSLGPQLSNERPSNPITEIPPRLLAPLQ